MAGGLA
ncbi:hypothetical protein D018_3330A, partial [Vibrio parahaemolyticus VP2007-007]